VIADVTPLLAAIEDPGLLGKVVALAAQLEKHAGSDRRYEPLAHAADRLWVALLRRWPLEVHRAVQTILAECDRLD
jgi:hypothetical protein